MVSILLIIFVSLLIFLAWMRIKIGKNNNFFNPAIFVTSFISIWLFIWVILLINEIGIGHAIDSKITMYEEENATIEEKINVSVKSYMDFEANAYAEIKDKDFMNLVSLFPELKSDTLIQKQIEMYIENSDQIKKLREEKIDLSISKWLLYFGK